MSTVHTLLYGSLVLVVISVFSAWMAGREQALDDWWVTVIWKVIATSLSICGMVGILFLPIAWDLSHVHLTGIQLFMFIVILSGTMLWALAQMILLKREFA